MPRSCCTHSCLITLGLVIGDISSALSPLHMDLPLYHGFSIRPGNATDNQPYNYWLIMRYLPIGITLLVAHVSAMDAAYIPLLHRLLIHSISVWWNSKERVIVFQFLVACSIPDCCYFPTGRLQLPTITFIHFYIPNEVNARTTMNWIDLTKRHGDTLFIPFAGICIP